MSRKLMMISPALLVLPLAFVVLMAAGCRQEADVADANATALPSASAPALADVSEAEQAQIDVLVGSYLDIRQLLADDKIEGVSENLVAIAQAAQTLSESDESELKDQAQKVAARAATTPGDLDEARDQFQEISDAVIALVKVAPPSDEVSQSLYVAYCPMAKATWLQAEDELANPYMGQEMLACGEIRETLALGDLRGSQK